MKTFYGADGVPRYITGDREAIDAIAFRFYGVHDGTTELLLEANPGIADVGPLLPAGTTLILPPAPARNGALTQVRLFD